jgi:alpha-ketoglutarate-dependent 2,4-dichlorophenoxyacetate dioxygenase
VAQNAPFEFLLTSPPWYHDIFTSSSLSFQLLKMPVATKLTVKPLAPTFAAEIEGVDFSQSIPDDIFHELEGVASKYGVLIFRNTELDDLKLIEFGRRFGELDSSAQHIVPGKSMRIPHHEIFDVSNLNEMNEIITINDPVKLSAKNGNATWHADGAFNPRRTGFSMLRAVELPPKGTGGETEYSDSRAAYDDLSDEMKEKIKGLVGCNSLVHNRKRANPDMEMFKNVNPLDRPMAKHKIASFHEPSGRYSLYVTSYTHHVDGMPMEEGQNLIKLLFEHVQQEKYKFVHHWEGPGDMAMWDNTAVLHRATHGSYGDKYRRDVRRVSVFDTGSEAYGHNDPSTWGQQIAP